MVFPLEIKPINNKKNINGIFIGFGIGGEVKSNVLRVAVDFINYIFKGGENYKEFF